MMGGKGERHIAISRVLRPGDRMNYDQLVSFVTTAEAGSFAQACKKLYISKASLKQRVDSLEAEIGMPLFARSNSGVTLTDVGTEVCAAARNIVSLWDETIESARKIDSQKTVRLVTIDSSQFPALPFILRRYKDSHPHVRVSVIPLPSSDQIPAVIEGRGDVCYSGVFRAHPALERLPVDKSRDVVGYLKPGHPLAGRPSIGIDDLTGIDLIARHEFISPRFQEMLDERGLVCHDINSADSTQRITRIIDGGGMLLATRSFGSIFDCVAVPFVCDPCPLSIYLYHRTDAPDHVRAFAQAALHVLAN